MNRGHRALTEAEKKRLQESIKERKKRSIITINESVRFIMKWYRPRADHWQLLRYNALAREQTTRKSQKCYASDVTPFKVCDWP